jgi:hypothetical protein
MKHSKLRIVAIVSAVLFSGFVVGCDKKVHEASAKPQQTHLVISSAH